VSESHEAEAKGKPSLSLGIIGPLVGLLMVILTNVRGFLDPFVFSLSVAVLSVAICTIAVYGFAISPLLPMIKRRLKERQQDNIASETLPRLADLVDKFAELASTRYAFGIHRAIQSFQVAETPEHQDARQAMLAEVRFLTQTLLSNYSRLMSEPVDRLQSDIKQSLRVRGKRFLLTHFGEDFFNLTRTYKSLFMNSYVESCKRVGIDSVSIQSREEYARLIGKYNQFVVSYRDFAKKVNALMGERTLGDYLEDATPLKV
jgi:hypothetical protein